MNPTAPPDFYQAYGLRIRSELELPQLQSTAAQATDLEVRFGRVVRRRADSVAEGFGFWAEGDRACHIVSGVGAFQVTAGREILVEPEPDAARDLLRLSVLGPALALALHQRGFFTLHASSVAINGAGVAFLGQFASGKSTMAAALRQLGHRFTGDDLAAVSLEGPSPRLVPGFPQHKLWPDAALNLGFSPDELPRVHPEHEKRALRLTESFDYTPLPLRRLYVLAVDDVVAVEALPPLQRFEEVVGHWYGARFGPTFIDAIDLRSHFERAGQLARKVPIRRLGRPLTLKEDSELSKTIEREILQDLAEDLG